MNTIVKQLETEVNKIGSINPTKEGFYKTAVAAALVKSYEFLSFSVTNKDDSYIFFTLGSLRGICEDFIVLSFLEKLDTDSKNEFIQTHMYLKFQESLARQEKFFKSERSFQPIVKPNEDCEVLIQQYKKVLKDIGEKSGKWKNTTMPKIHTMAESLGLSDYYQFYYTLSSETVHFNSRVLLRMGWSDNDDMVNFQFSTTNFSKYYKEYGVVYSSLLFIQFCHKFSDILNIPHKFTQNILKLEKYVSDILRWPEPITFEELNKDGPSEFIRHLFKITYESSNKTFKSTPKDGAI